MEFNFREMGYSKFKWHRFQLWKKCCVLDECKTFEIHLNKLCNTKFEGGRERDR